MSNLRTFGTEISGNRRKNESLSPETRAAICASVAAGTPKTVVARLFKINRRTVNRTQQRYAERRDFRSRPRSGRPRSLNTREERYLVRLARRFPRVSWKALVQLDGARVSLSTVKSIMRRKNLRKWRSKRRPKLTAAHAQKRRAFCRHWLSSGRLEELTSVRVLDE